MIRRLLIKLLQRLTTEPMPDNRIVTPFVGRTPRPLVTLKGTPRPIEPTTAGLIINMRYRINT